jgi:hypothetical protein
MIPIAGAIAYAAYERWQESEEKKQAMTFASGGDDIKDVKEQLRRIEKLLRDVG